MSDLGAGRLADYIQRSVAVEAMRALSTHHSRSRLSTYTRLTVLALRHPGLILPLLRAGWAFRARGWYKRPPFLPLPPASYLQWRMETAYGDAGATPPADELNRYLRWTSDMRNRR